MKSIAALLLPLCAAAAFAQGGGAPAATPSKTDLYAAQCVAALEVQTEALAEQVKAGNEAQRKLLLDRLTAGTAFVGDTYLNSKLNETQARALAQEAHEAQKSLPPAELAARQNACASAGSKLYSDSNGVQKMVVDRLAKKRMQKLLRTT